MAYAMQKKMRNSHTVQQGTFLYSYIGSLMSMWISRPWQMAFNRSSVGFI
jgi:hypothetical protein